MRSSRLDVRVATAAEWDAAWAACPHTTYVQSRAWSEDWTAYTPCVQREGVRERRATSATDAEAYSRICDEALARWAERASSRYGPCLFELLRRSDALGVGRLLAALDDGSIIAGGLCPYGPRHASCWHAALSQLLSLRPANLLVHEMALDACLRSLAWFDLNPSGGHEGVRVFKERVGTVALPSAVIVYGETRAALVDRALRLTRGRADGRA